MNLADGSNFIRIIHADVKHSFERLNDNADFDFWARSYIRAFASLIEGTAFIYKNIAISLWAEGKLHLTTEQQLFFHNLDWRVGQSGEIETTEKRLPTVEGLKALFAQLGVAIFGSKPDFGGKGWAGIKLFYGVRDNLIHPKTLQALKPDKATLLAIEEGRAWFNSHLKEVNDELLRRLTANG